MDTAPLPPKPKIILVVDDDPSFCEIFSAHLSASGYHVETAQSAAEGIMKAKSFHPDLILMDVKMPGTTGTDAVLQLKNDPETASIKVLFLTSTGSVQGEEVNEKFALEMGAAGYIKKSENLADIVLQIGKVLQPRE